MAMKAVRELGYEIASLVSNHPEKPPAYHVLKGGSADCTLPSLSRVVRAFHELAEWIVTNLDERDPVVFAIRSIGFGPGERPIKDALTRAIAEIPGEKGRQALQRARIIATIHSHESWMPSVVRRLMSISAGPGLLPVVADLLDELSPRTQPVDTRVMLPWLMTNLTPI